MTIAVEKIESEGFITSMSPKGQVVISKEIRDELGLKPKDKFIEKIRDKKIILERAPTINELKASWKKAMKGKTTKQVMKEIDEGWDI